MASCFGRLKLTERDQIENCKSGQLFWRVKVDAEEPYGELQGLPVLACES